MTSKQFSRQAPKWQIVAGLILVALMLLFGFTLAQKDGGGKLAFALAIGMGFGYTLTRSRYGFAGGIKRIYVRGEGSLSVALLIAFAVLILVYGSMQWVESLSGAVPQYLAQEGDKVISGTQNVFMFNIGTAAGAFIFGIGMIIAGGCASGTLADLGEGEGHALLAFPLFVLGTIPGHYLREVIDRNPIGKVGVRLHLPQIFGYFGSFVVSFAILFMLYLVVKAYERKRKAEGTYRSETSDYEDFEKELEVAKDEPVCGWALYHKFFVQRWSFITGSMVLGFLSVAWFVVNKKAWGVTSAFTNMAVWFVGLFGIKFTDPGFDKINAALEKGILSNAGVVLDIGIVVGSLLCFLLACRFQANMKFNGRNALLFGLGGLMMGFGSRLAKGCNIGALYSSLTVFSLSGWLFLIFISLGAVAALKIFAKGKSCLVPPRHRHPDDFK